MDSNGVERQLENLISRINNPNLIVDYDSHERHCSVCRKGISGPDVKVCSKCKRRAYCSRECQRIDWVRKGTKDIKGQGHKHWCELLCGEEDIDWKIAPINGNGLGVVAKRLIPANYRIVVEGFGAKDVFGKGVCQSLDILKKVNHSCDPNSFRSADPDFGTQILCSKRQIQAGEEITVSYNGYSETFLPIPDVFGVLHGKTTMDNFQDARDVLVRKFGINCSTSCPCREKEMNGIDALIEEGRKALAALLILDPEEQQNYSKKDCIVDCIIIGKLLELTRRTDPDSSGSIMRAFILEKGFEVYMQMQDCLPLALRFMKEAYEIWSTAPMHPESEKCKRIKAALDDHKQAKGYLRFDQETYKTNTEEPEGETVINNNFNIFLKEMASKFNM